MKGDEFLMRARDRFLKVIPIPLTDLVDKATLKQVKKQANLQDFFHESGERQSFLNPCRSDLAKS